VDATPSDRDHLFLEVVLMRLGRRYGLSAAQKTEIWRRWKAGESLHEIGRAFGKDHGSIHFNEAIHLSPNFERAYYDRGNAYIDKGEYDRAIQEFDEAIRLNPNNADNYNNRGVAYSRKGDYGRAIQNYNQAINLNSNDTVAYLNRGVVYFVQSNLTAAIADFEHALYLHVVMKRQGHNDAQQLARVEAAADLSKWPGPVLKLDLEQATANEVMVAAATGIPVGQKWQVCEANYFIGEEALLHYQRTTALAHLKAARDGCRKGDLLYAAALMELKRLSGSAVPRK
jgi:tetratricopeptide (TPR) repeat protein